MVDTKKVYISRTKGSTAASLHKVITLMQMMFNYPEISMYNPGEQYTDKKLLDSHFVVFLIPKDLIIGKGMYSEMELCSRLGKKAFLFLEEPLLFESVISYFGNPSRIVDSGDWSRYAIVQNFKDFKNVAISMYLNCKIADIPNNIGFETKPKVKLNLLLMSTI